MQHSPQLPRWMASVHEAIWHHPVSGGAAPRMACRKKLKGPVHGARSDVLPGVDQPPGCEGGTASPLPDGVRAPPARKRSTWKTDPRSGSESLPVRCVAPPRSLLRTRVDRVAAGRARRRAVRRTCRCGLNHQQTTATCRQNQRTTNGNGAKSDPFVRGVLDPAGCLCPRLGIPAVLKRRESCCKS